MTETVIATIPKNSRESVRVSLSNFNGADLINLRVWFTSSEGELRPGKHGLALRIEKLPELVAALQAAETEAKRQGLLT